MSLPEIYFSCPLSVPSKKELDIRVALVKLVTDIFKRGDFNVTHYERGTSYTGQELVRAKALVIRHPTNDFSFKSNELSAGVRKELFYALENNIPVFLSYTRVNGEDSFYNIVVSSTSDKDIVMIQGRTTIRVDSSKLGKALFTNPNEESLLGSTPKVVAYTTTRVTKPFAKEECFNTTSLSLLIP